MRKGLIYLLCTLSLLFLPTISRAEEKSDEELLQETVLLAKDVKSFAETLGIPKTAALSKSSLEARPASMTWIWIQKKGTLPLSSSIDLRVALLFNDAKEKTSFRDFGVWGDHSGFLRSGNDFAGDDSVITPAFAKEDRARKVESIAHEDIHGLFQKHLWEINESVTTALGFLVAREYFTQNGDTLFIVLLNSRIHNLRNVSRELNAFAERAALVLSASRDYGKIAEIIPQYPAYKDFIDWTIEEGGFSKSFEAKVAHDLGYYRYFDAIVHLYEESGNLKELIADLKESPKTLAAFESYLKTLEEKYKRPGTN